MSRVLRTRAPGKVNLCLFVGPTDPHCGLHEVVTVMEPLSLADDVTAAPAFGLRADEVHCPGVEGENLALTALRRFRERTGWDGPPLRVEIDKRVPVAAGMGGGSSDAAAALRLVARAAGGDGDLHAVAATLGSDVPGLLRTGPTLVTGTGDRVEPLAGLPPHGLVALPVAAELSAGEVYREADRLGLAREATDLAERRAAVRAALDRGDLAALVHNDLEEAARSLCPLVDGALRDARLAGADHALVTGSGPTVVGLFLGEDGPLRAQGAVARVRDRHPRAVAATPVAPDFGEVRAG